MDEISMCCLFFMFLERFDGFRCIRFLSHFWKESIFAEKTGYQSAGAIYKADQPIRPDRTPSAAKG